MIWVHERLVLRRVRRERRRHADGMAILLRLLRDRHLHLVRRRLQWGLLRVRRPPIVGRVVHLMWRRVGLRARRCGGVRIIVRRHWRGWLVRIVVWRVVWIRGHERRAGPRGRRRVRIRVLIRIVRRIWAMRLRRIIDVAHWRILQRCITERWRWCSRVAGATARAICMEGAAITKRTSGRSRSAARAAASSVLLVA